MCIRDSHRVVPRRYRCGRGRLPRLRVRYEDTHVGPDQHVPRRRLSLARRPIPDAVLRLDMRGGRRGARGDSGGAMHRAVDRFRRKRVMREQGAVAASRTLGLLDVQKRPLQGGCIIF